MVVLVVTRPTVDRVDVERSLAGVSVYSSEFNNPQIPPAHLDPTPIVDLQRDVPLPFTDLFIGEVDHLRAVDPRRDLTADDPKLHRIPLPHAQR